MKSLFWLGTLLEDKLKDQFDLQYLKEVVEGMKFLAQMIAVFKHEQRLTIEKMKAAVYNQDWEGLSKVAISFVLPVPWG